MFLYYIIVPLLIIIAIIAAIIGVTIGSKSNGLDKVLKELIENNVLNEEEVEKVKNYYLNKKESSTTGANVIYIIGIVLVALGIILFVAYNWYMIPRLGRVSIGMVVLIASIVLFGYNIYKHKTSLIAVEGSSIFLSLMVAANIALISQTYNIMGSFSSFLLTWMLLILPIPYLYGSAVVSIFYMIGITIWMFIPEANFSDINIHLNGLPFIVILPFVLRYLANNEKTRRHGLIEVFLFFTFIINIYTQVIWNSTIFNYVTSLVYILVVMATISLTFGKLGLIKTHSMAKKMIIGIFLILLFIPAHNSGITSDEDLISNLLSILLTISAFVSIIYLSIKHELENLMYLVAPMVIVTLLLFIPGEYVNWIINLYLIVLSFILILKSNRNFSTSTLNSGLLIAIVIILKWFFAVSDDIFSRALGMIIAGVVLIVCNKLLINKKKEVHIDE